MTSGDTELVRRLRELPRTERAAALQEVVLGEFRRALLMTGADELPLTDNYFTYGLTSLQVVDIKQNLESALGCEVEAGVLLGTATVAQVLAYLTDRQLPQLGLGAAVHDVPAPDVPVPTAATVEAVLARLYEI
jgi:acyl carrier protein